MKEGATAEVRVESIGAGGAGVARLPDGRVCFVHRTAPGDRARVQVTDLKASWARGELVELLEPGPGRRRPPCPFYERCGGCTLEHLTYDMQLRAKRRIVTDALERIGGVEHPPLGPVRPSPEEFGYRSRVTFHLRRLSRGRVVAGFHELERPGRIVDVDGRCLLPEDPLGRVWDGLRGAWGPGAVRLPGGRALRLTLRRSVEGAVLVVEPEEARGGRGGRGTGPEDRPHAGRPGELLERVDGLAALWWRPARTADAGGASSARAAEPAERSAATGGPGSGGEAPPPDGGPRLLAGNPDAREPWWGREVRAGPGAFLQVNRAAAVELHEEVLRRVGDPAGLRVVDAYCGVGTYGRALAERGAQAVGIETDEEAVAAAREGAPAGFRVLQGRVEERLESALPADLVLLNPPRSGLDEAVPARLRASGVARVVYVSCDPATLARDLDRLGGPYRIAALEAFDLFPQTAHVEVLCVLERRNDQAPTGDGGR